MDENPSASYSLAQVAAYCSRTYQTLRFYYAQELLPEPKYSIKRKNKTTRKFTLQEAKSLKAFFESIQHGTVANIKRRRGVPNGKTKSRI